MKKILFLFVGFLFVCNAHAQLSGEYTIDPTQPYAGTNFQSFDVAVMVLNAQGISGPVTFKVKAGSVFEENVRTITMTGTESNPITFIRDGAGNNPVIQPPGSGTLNDVAIWVYKGSYFTFDGIDIQSADGNTDIEYGYYFFSQDEVSCSNNTVKNCNILLNNSNSGTYGIRFYNFNNLTVGNDNNLIQNVTIQNTFQGIKMDGRSDIYDSNNSIENCTIQNLGVNNVITAVYGISYTYQTGLNISGCIIDNLTGSSYVNGLYASAGYNDFTIQGCTISNIVSNGTTSSNAAGIYFTYGGTGDIDGNSINGISCAAGTSTNVQGIYITNFNNEVVIKNNQVYNLLSPCTGGGYANGISVAGTGVKKIFNNMLGGISAPGSTSTTAVCGIRATGTGNISIWHNTVLIDYTPTSTGSSCAVYLGQSSPYLSELLNNIFINNSDYSVNGTRAMALCKTAAALIASTSDHNIYYAGEPGSKNLIAFLGTSPYQTLADYQAAVSPVDANSYTENTYFVLDESPYDLHINNTRCTYADGRALYLLDVDVDTDGESRNITTPDIGADEFVGITLASYAGEDDLSCENSITLAAGDPTIYGASGEWSIIDGGGTINSISSSNSLVTDLSEGLNTFRWTVSSSGCYSVYDDVNITYVQVTTAIAGEDQFICSDYTTLEGNEPGTGESGMWTLDEGTGIFTNANLYNTAVTSVGPGSNAFVWTLSESSCTSSDTVLINNSSVFANAGDDYTVCTNTAALNGNEPGEGNQGIWEILSGSAIIENNTLYETNLSDLSTGMNTFRWTVWNPNCEASDDVSITYEQIIADFQILSYEGLTVHFENLSSPDASEYYWEFGDGQTQTDYTFEQFVDHSYAASGNYTVTLSVDGSICNDAKEIVLDVVGMSEISDRLNIHPNPFSDMLYIDSERHIKEIKLIDITGKTSFVYIPNKKSMMMDLSGLHSGIYTIEIKSDSGTQFHKIVKR